MVVFNHIKEPFKNVGQVDLHLELLKVLSPLLPATYRLHYLYPCHVSYTIYIPVISLTLSISLSCQLHYLYPCHVSYTIYIPIMSVTLSISLSCWLHYLYPCHVGYTIYIPIMSVTLSISLSCRLHYLYPCHVGYTWYLCTKVDVFGECPIICQAL